MKNVGVLSVEIFACVRGELRETVAGLLRGREQAAIAKVNAEFLLLALADDEFNSFLGSTRLNVADGIGVLWAARFLSLRTTGIPVLRHLQTMWQAAYSLAALVFLPRFCRVPIPERIPGVDALMTMLEAAEDAGSSVYFLGAKPEVNERARAKIASAMPGLKIAGGCDGYHEDWDPVLRDIEESKAALLIVALGCPKQEFWIQKHLGALNHVRVAVGEGGSLDFIAGDFRRAPRWMQVVNIEWLWRMFMNRNKSGSASRARRVWNAVVVFVFKTVQWKLAHGTSVTECGEPA